MRSMTYAGIGSRNTPEPVLGLMQRFATRLEALGYTFRSGPSLISRAIESLSDIARAPAVSLVFAGAGCVGS